MSIQSSDRSREEALGRRAAAALAVDGVGVPADLAARAVARAFAAEPEPDFFAQLVRVGVRFFAGAAATAAVAVVAVTLTSTSAATSTSTTRDSDDAWTSWHSAVSSAGLTDEES